MKCPNADCSKEILNPIIKNHNKGEDNIHNLPHNDCECPFCGRRFNQWIAPDNLIKEIFTKSYNLYQ